MGTVASTGPLSPVSPLSSSAAVSSSAALSIAPAVPPAHEAKPLSSVRWYHVVGLLVGTVALVASIACALLLGAIPSLVMSGIGILVLVGVGISLYDHSRALQLKKAIPVVAPVVAPIIAPIVSPAVADLSLYTNLQATIQEIMTRGSRAELVKRVLGYDIKEISRERLRSQTMIRKVPLSPEERVEIFSMVREVEEAWEVFKEHLTSDQESISEKAGQIDMGFGVNIKLRFRRINGMYPNLALTKESVKSKKTFEGIVGEHGISIMDPKNSGFQEDSEPVSEILCAVTRDELGDVSKIIDPKQFNVLVCAYLSLDLAGNIMLINELVALAQSLETRVDGS